MFFKQFIDFKKITVFEHFLWFLNYFWTVFNCFRSDFGLFYSIFGPVFIHFWFIFGPISVNFWSMFGTFLVHFLWQVEKGRDWWRQVETGEDRWRQYWQTWTKVVFDLKMLTSHISHLTDQSDFKSSLQS